MSLEIPSNSLSLSPEKDSALFRQASAQSTEAQTRLRDAQLKVEPAQQAAPASVNVSLSAAGKASLAQEQEQQKQAAPEAEAGEKGGAVPANESGGLNIDKIIKNLKQQIKELEQRLSDLEPQADSESGQKEYEAILNQLNSLRSALLEAQTQQLTGA